jgi:hypothetical protein
MGNYFVTSGIRSFVFLTSVGIVFVLIIKFYYRPPNEQDAMHKNTMNGRIVNHSMSRKPVTSGYYFTGRPVRDELKNASPAPEISAYSACIQVPGIARLRHTNSNILLQLVSSKAVTEHFGGHEFEVVNIDDLNLTLDSLYPRTNAR